jgi:hypothetical protein
VDFDVLHCGSCVSRSEHPRGNVGIVVEASDEYLVPWPPRLRQRTREGEGHGCHVRAEGDLTRIIGADKIGEGLMGLSSIPSLSRLVANNPP